MKKQQKSFLREAFRSWLAISFCLLLSVGSAYSQVVIENLPPCVVNPTGPNLVFNGDFEAGNTGFNTEYRHITKPCCCATYAVRPDAYAFHPTHWWTRDDHTFGPGPVGNTQGLFFIGDADCPRPGNTPKNTAWSQEVNIQPGVYAFEGWVSNLDNQQYKDLRAIFSVFVDGIPVFTQEFVLNIDLGRWKGFCGQFPSAITGRATLSIDVRNEVSGLLGGDFGLDDISFRSMCIGGGDPAFTSFRRTTCVNEVILFTPANPAGIHTWSFPGGAPATSNTAAAQTVYTTPGTYTVTHTVSSVDGNCPSTHSEQIIVTDCLPLPDCETSLCGNNLVTNGDFENGNNSFTSDLTYTTAFGACGGRYTIDEDATLYSGTDNKGSTWTAYGDHTPPTGTKFMIGDPDCTDADGAIVWRQTVNTTIGTAYNFSAWLYNLCEEANQPVVALRVNGNRITIPTPLPPKAGETSVNVFAVWTQVCGKYLATGTSALLEIEIGPASDLAIAADFGLDDITFRKIGTISAAFTAGPGKLCAGSPVSFTSAAVGANHTWDFGDPSSGANNTSTVANPTHVYNLHGTYTVTHHVVDAEGCEATTTQTITVENCCSVDALFTYGPDPNADATECRLQFTDQSTFSAQTGGIDSWSWTMTDQNGTVTIYNYVPADPDHNPDHLFSGKGPHMVCLTVTGSTGGETCTDQFCMEVNSPCNVAECDATFITSEQGCAGSEITFTSVPNSATTTHSWDFGDEDSPDNTSTSENPTHVFNLAGTYWVTHTVTDPSNGCTHTYTVEITIDNCCSVTAAFRYVPGDDPSECEMTFIDESVAGSSTTITQWKWIFDDANGGHEEVTANNNANVPHTFSGTGTHTVCLVVSGQSGGYTCTDTHCQQVTTACTVIECDADFTMTTERCVGSVISFTSAPNDPSSVHSWDFGDGGTAGNVNTTTYTYNTAGTYTVTHVVTNGDCEDFHTEVITIINCCTIDQAAFTSTPDDDLSECKMTFTDASVAGPGSAITAWKWTITDNNNGAQVTGNNSSITYTFSSPGPHTVCLEVTAQSGTETCTSTICQAITSPCVQCLMDVCFTWTQFSRTSGLAGTVTLDFDATCSELVGTAPGVVRTWMFVDPLKGPEVRSGTEHQQYIFNTVNGGGMATVCLNITNPEPIYPTDPECVNDCHCEVINLATLVGTPADCPESLTGRVGRPGNTENTEDAENQVELDGNTVSAFPNPFSGTLNIVVQMKEASELSIEILDLNGKVVNSLTNDYLDKGTHQFSWNAQPEYADGIYVLRIKSRNNLSYQKVNLIR